jgi:hypothetical protein
VTEPTVWETLHFPVLKASVEGVIADRTSMGVNLRQLATTTGLELTDVLAAVRQLQHTGHLELRLVGPAARGRVVRVSEKALQEVGQWPTAETGVDRLIAALEQIAQNTDDDDERTRLQQFAGFLKSSGQQVGLSLVTAVLTGQVT